MKKLYSYKSIKSNIKKIKINLFNSNHQKNIELTILQ